VLDELLGALPFSRRRTVPVREALGMVLSEPLLATAAVPAIATALRVGFAVASQDLIGACPYSPVPLMLAPVRVAPGEPLPPGTDAVLPGDCVQTGGPLLEAVASLGPGENALRPGEEAHAGQVLRGAGEVLRPLDVAMAEAAGTRAASVRRARVAIIAQERATASAFGALAGAEVRHDGQLSGFRETLTEADLAVVVTEDPSSVALDRIVAHGLALRPGEAAQVGFIGGTPVVVCPPRLDALFALGRCLVDPLVRHLTGQRPPVPWRRAPLTRKVASTVGFTEVALLRTTAEGLEPLAVGSLSFAALGQADAWMPLAPESEGFGAGETVAAEAL
jgi:molybdopterin biosynthesis enzyme